MLRNYTSEKKCYLPKAPKVEIGLSDRAMAIVLSCTDDELAELTVNDIARKLSITVPYLSKRFKLDMEFSLKDLIRQVKLYKCVSELTTNPDISVREVSKLFGFCSVDYFCKVFKSYFGISPGRYRKMCLYLKSCPK